MLSNGDKLNTSPIALALSESTPRRYRVDDSGVALNMRSRFCGTREHECNVTANPVAFAYMTHHQIGTRTPNTGKNSIARAMSASFSGVSLSAVAKAPGVSLETAES